jgi:hypothetical protein
MEENSGIAGIVDSLDTVEHCSECGHAWMQDEPVHYADCRFFMLDEPVDDDDEEGIEAMAWKTFRPALLQG